MREFILIALAAIAVLMMVQFKQQNMILDRLAYIHAEVEQLTMVIHEATQEVEAPEFKFEELEK